MTMTTKTTTTLAILLTGAAIGLTACDSGGDDTPQNQTQPIEVTGAWVDEYQTELTIDEATWGTSTIARFDNAANTVVIQAPSDDQFNPDKFSKLVWTEPGADAVWYYCTVAFGKDTEADAAAVAVSADNADESDLTTAGCGGFPWTKVMAK